MGVLIMNSVSKVYSDIIKEICKENKINVTFLSDGYVAILEKNNIKKHIIGYKYDLNYQGLANIADDKYATYELLKHYNFNVMEYKLVFKNTNFEDCLKYFYENNNHLVIKPVNGTCGNQIQQVFNVKELKSTINRLLEFNSTITLSPFYNIKNEYRVIIVNKEVKFSYKKERPIVIGNGINSIKELLYNFNPIFFDKEKAFYNKEINENSILEKDKTLEYGWMFNLSKGAKISLDLENNKEFIEIFAKNICKKLDLNLVSIDIVELFDGSFKVIEINSGMMMDNLIKQLTNGKEIAKSIYTEIILSMLK